MFFPTMSLIPFSGVVMYSSLSLKDPLLTHDENFKYRRMGSRNEVGNRNHEKAFRY